MPLSKLSGPIRLEAERNLALLAYGLLGFSIFFAGTTALIAVIIAYVLHDAATEELSDHFRNQIRIFWIGLGLLVLTMVAALVAVLGAAGNLLHDAPPSDLVGRIEVWGYEADLSGLRLTPLVVAAIVVSAASAFLGGLWMIAASAIGFIRLASRRHLGETARK